MVINWQGVIRISTVRNALACEVSHGIRCHCYTTMNYLFSAGFSINLRLIQIHFQIHVIFFLRSFVVGFLVWLQVSQ